MVNNLSAMEETWVRSLGQEDPLEEGIIYLLVGVVTNCVTTISEAVGK